MFTSRKIAWIVWIIASIFYAYQYILRVMPSVMSDDIMQQFQIGTATLGQFSGIYYIGYSLMHLPLGIMLDRYGPKKVMTVCIVISVIGLMPLIFANHWAYSILGRFLTGVGSSAAILGVFKVIRMTFSEERFPRMLSFSVTIGLIGAIYGGSPLAYMRQTLGYQTTIEVLAAAGLVLALVTYLLVPNTKMADTEQNSAFSSIKEVISNKRVIGACLAAGLMVGPIEGFADVWGTAFFKSVYGFSETLAASLPSLIFIGMCFGAPLLNFVAEKSGNYLATIAGAGLFMAGSFSWLLLGSPSSELITVLFIIVGICCGYQILAIYKASSYVRAEVVGLATALANMIIMMFGYAFHSIIGKVIDLMGGASSSQAISYGISVIPVALVLGSLGFLFLLLNDRQIAKK